MWPLQKELDPVTYAPLKRLAKQLRDKDGHSHLGVCRRQRLDADGALVEDYGGWATAKQVGVPASAGVLHQLIDEIRGHLPQTKTWDVCWWFNLLHPPGQDPQTGFVRPTGDWIQRHDHSVSHQGAGDQVVLNEWAALYYLDGAGPIVFHPDSGADMAIEAKPGLLLVFPAGLAHSVPEHKGPGRRLALAFNAR